MPEPYVTIWTVVLGGIALAFLLENVLGSYASFEPARKIFDPAKAA